MFDAACAQIAVQPGFGRAVGFQEGGIAVDIAVRAFAQDERGMGDGEIWGAGPPPRLP